MQWTRHEDLRAGIQGGGFASPRERRFRISDGGSGWSLGKGDTQNPCVYMVPLPGCSGKTYNPSRCHNTVSSGRKLFKPDAKFIPSSNPMVPADTAIAGTRSPHRRYRFRCASLTTARPQETLVTCADLFCATAMGISNAFCVYFRSMFRRSSGNPLRTRAEAICLEQPSNCSIRWS